MTTNEFLAEWASLTSDEASVNRRLFPDLPLEIRVGRDSSGRPMMAVETPQKMADPPQVIGIEIYSTSAPNEVNWLVIALDDGDSIDEFAVFCQDLVDQVRSAENPDEGLRSLLSCLERWRNLFLPRRGKILSDTALRSLMSEIVALVHLAKKRGTLPDAVRAWVGPKGSPQDFQFEIDSVAYEVKAIHRDQTSFIVSSIDQLDSADYSVYVLIVQLEDLGPNERGGMQIVELIKLILKDLQTFPQELVLFQSNLKELGFSLSQREYQHRAYAVDRVTTYFVGSNFPRLNREDLPSAILSAKYELESKELGEFLLAEEEISSDGLMGVI